jgi:hypothetical protein
MVKLTGFGMIWSKQKEPNVVANSLTAGNRLATMTWLTAKFV